MNIILILKIFQALIFSSDYEEMHIETFYPELHPKEAQALVKQYNQDAINAGAEQKKVIKDYLRRNFQKRQSIGGNGPNDNPVGKPWVD